MLHILTQVNQTADVFIITYFPEAVLRIVTCLTISVTIIAEQHVTLTLKSCFKRDSLFYIKFSMCIYVIQYKLHLL